MPHSNHGKYFCTMASSTQTGTLKQQQPMCNDINGLAFLGSNICTGLNLSPSERGWLHQEENNLQNKGENSLKMCRSYY